MNMVRLTSIQTLVLVCFFGSLCTMAVADDPFEKSAHTNEDGFLKTFPPKVLGFAPDVVTSRDKLDNYVNKLVVVRGKLSSGKIRKILGVEVKADEAFEGSSDVFAVGLLRKFSASVSSPVVSTADWKGEARYILYEDLKGSVAKAYLVQSSREAGTGHE